MPKNLALLVLFIVGLLFFAATTLLANPSVTNVIYLPFVEKPAQPTATPIPPTATPVQPTATPIPPSGCSICTSDTYNCSDFSTQAEAQACHDYCVNQGAGDIHRLDRDNNGIACESLPDLSGFVPLLLP